LRENPTFDETDGTTALMLRSIPLEKNSEPGEKPEPAEVPTPAPA